MNTQEARMAGEDAYYNGLDETDNPFPVEHDNHLSWNDGWLNAQENDDNE